MLYLGFPGGVGRGPAVFGGWMRGNGSQPPVRRPNLWGLLPSQASSGWVWRWAPAVGIRTDTKQHQHFKFLWQPRTPCVSSILGANNRSKSDKERRDPTSIFFRKYWWGACFPHSCRSLPPRKIWVFQMIVLRTWKSLAFNCIIPGVYQAWIRSSFPWWKNSH